RLQRHARHAGDRREHPLQLPHQLQGTLHVRCFLIWVQTGEAVEGGELLVDDRVVLHGARPERVDALVQVVIAPRETSEVPGQDRLRHRGHRRVTAAQQARGQERFETAAGHSRLHDAGAALVLLAQLEHQRFRSRPPRLDAAAGHDGTFALEGTATGAYVPATSRAALTYRSIAAGAVI